MIKFDFSPLSKIAAENGVGSTEFSQYEERQEELMRLTAERGQGFWNIIDESCQAIKDFAQSVKYENVAVLAIGGSSLGAICLQQSLTNLFEKKSLTVLDNIDPEFLAEYAQQIDLKKTLFMVITKSGGTPETLAQFFYFRDLLEHSGLDWKKQMIFITDPKKGYLRKLASETGVKTFDVPENVGGRFSVLTNVGLLPAALMGLDVDKLLEGARLARLDARRTTLVENPAFQLAAAQHLLYLKGKVMNVIFPYAQKLIRFADWYRQLLAESIGKAVNLKGEQVNVGITPVFALGATDQHSQNQLYNEGPNDKLFLFMSVKEQSANPVIPDSDLPTELNYLKGVSFQKLLHTEMAGTIAALQKQDRPMIQIELEKLDEFHLGYLFFIFEAATAFLGEMFEINTYDQPGVELSKQLTREML